MNKTQATLIIFGDIPILEIEKRWVFVSVENQNELISRKLTVLEFTYIGKVEPWARTVKISSTSISAFRELKNQ